MKNQVKKQILKQILSDNPTQDHIVDFDNFPAGWDSVFNTDEFGSYDEISMEDRKERAENLINAIKEMQISKENELESIVKHFTSLYDEEIENNEITSSVIHEWWTQTKDQYSDHINYLDVEEAILKVI